METIFSIALGIGLSAACGFRVFVPFLVASVASWLGFLPLTSGFEWLGTVPAIAAFSIATLLEIAAYYVPWIDNALDSIATPAAVIAGALAAASVMTDMPPLMRWGVALVGGGGVAGAVQGTTAILRMVSSTLTGGAGNAILSTGEWILSVITSILSILIPLVAVVFVVFVLLVSWRTGRRLRDRKVPSRILPPHGQ
jgi:hypothetical protein